MIHLAANCSTLFREVPFLERFGRARTAGFDRVEFWWPFAAPVPSRRDRKALVEALSATEVDVVCMNLYAGDLEAGERGVLNDPSRVDEFRAGVMTAAELSAQTGCRRFNALYGLRIEPVAESEDCAVRNLVFACQVLAEVGADVVVEPLCRNPRFGLPTLDAAQALIEHVRGIGRENIGLLVDFYQVPVTGLDMPQFIARRIADIWHVQLADDPGRGAPGTGNLPLFDWLAALDHAGYRGVVGLEYLDVRGVDPFDWIDRWRVDGPSEGQQPLALSRCGSASAPQIKESNK